MQYHCFILSRTIKTDTSSILKKTERKYNVTYSELILMCIYVEN